MAWILFGGFIALMILGVPAIFALLAATLAGVLWAGFGGMLFILPQQILDGVESDTLPAIPFFILAGNLMNITGVSDRIFAFADSLVGRFRGGLAQVNVLASLIFSGASGSALADISGMGTIEVEAMRKRGYPATFAAALTVATSMLGPMLPPSIGLIVYAYLSETSVARLFMATLVPGGLLAVFLMIYVAIVSRHNNFPKQAPAKPREVVNAGLHGIGALVTPAIILGGILTGWVTATEAGVLASFYALFLGLAYRTLNLKGLYRALVSTAFSSVFILMITGVSALVGWLIAIEQLPQAVAAFTMQFVENKAAFTVVLVLFLLIIGCFIESVPAKIILVPVLLPILDHFAIDRIQFGVMLTLALSIGIATPPMGVGLFIASKISNVPVERITIAVLPMMIPLILLLFLLSFFPQLSLFLPNLLLGQ
ncbi:TRAP transporter large permease [Salipiger mangrovisoli]|uniref:TRAP transporter large permease protein n=1 Tax=Salipiger mangrovisoli TaxID=2865933 RepID=A0ABR9X8H3_9RHOB|nr:TRAP transporter large permease [Salipiger mangrovisoli]MBE9639800.1 TRAP transporter large permease [Salipiger mangrovisoli]